MLNPSRRLGEFLVERKVLHRDDLETMLQREHDESVPLATLLVREGLVSEKDLVAAVAHQVNVRFIDLAETPIRPDVDRLIPEDVARAHQAVAVDISDDDLIVAMANPADRDGIRTIGEQTGWHVVPCISSREELARVLDSMYGPSPASTAPSPPEGSGGDEDVVVQMEGATESFAGAGPSTGFHINDFLLRVLDLDASDLHLTTGRPPMVRVNGAMRSLDEFPELTASEIRRMLYDIITQKQREKFEADLELDTSHSIPDKARFRLNVFLQRDSVGAVFRVIPFEIVPLEKLGLPPVVAEFADLPRGLVLVTGPTGSGKSTTLASLVDIVNSERASHIITVEDPIEFLHQHKQSIVNQREVGEDTHSFAEALKHVLRQDPDVILVGEMRDLETIHTALTAAETGHLVFATLHTQDAPQSVDRIIDVFPAHQQQQVRVQLSTALMGVVTQQLVPTKGGKGRVVAAEVMVATPAVRNLIREGKTHQIYSSMQAGGKYGMRTMDQSLAELVKTGVIELEVALERCANEEDIRRLIGSA